MNVIKTVSADEALTAEQTIQKLGHQVRELEHSLRAANATAEMYAHAWQRELGPPYRGRHHIDAMVLTTRDRMEEIAALKKEVKRLAAIAKEYGRQ